MLSLNIGPDVATGAFSCIMNPDRRHGSCWQPQELLDWQIDQRIAQLETREPISKQCHRNARCLRRDKHPGAHTLHSLTLSVCSILPSVYHTACSSFYNSFYTSLYTFFYTSFYTSVCLYHTACSSSSTLATQFTLHYVCRPVPLPREICTGHWRHWTDSSCVRSVL